MSYDDPTEYEMLWRESTKRKAEAEAAKARRGTPEFTPTPAPDDLFFPPDTPSSNASARLSPSCEPSQSQDSDVGNGFQGPATMVVQQPRQGSIVPYSSLQLSLEPFPLKDREPPAGLDVSTRVSRKFLQFSV